MLLWGSAFPCGSFVPLLAWDNGKVSRVSAFKADPFDWAVSVPAEGSSLVKYCKTRESGGGEECISA